MWEEPCRHGKVEEEKRSWRRPAGVPQPRSEDADVKEKPLAAMRMVLQKRRGSNPGAAALRQVPQQPQEAGGAKGPNMAAAPKRSWASVVRGTQQDQRTSLKRPPEEKDVREKTTSREEKR